MLSAIPPAPIGRFLEISVRTEDIRKSFEFYQSLGFAEASVGETWPHPYAVVTDGRLFIGLHAAPIPSPMLTFVSPHLAAGIGHLREQGVHFEHEHLGNDEFNQASFRDPSGLHVRLLEARTFSPPSLGTAITTTCGYFTEFGIPVRDAAAGRAFWEPLGFVAMDEEPAPFARTPLTGDLLNLGLYRTRSLRQPVLSFEDPDMRERLARLRERGFQLSDEMPDTLDESANAILRAPEGTQLLLLQSET